MLLICTIKCENKVLIIPSENKTISQINNLYATQHHINYKLILVLFSVILKVLFLPTAKAILHNKKNKDCLFTDLLVVSFYCSFVNGNIIRALRLKRKNDRII